MDNKQERTIKVIYDGIEVTVTIVGGVLIVPEGVKHVDCYHNQITELILNDSVRWVDCSHNQITELKLNDAVEWVDCSNNPLIV